MSDDGWHAHEHELAYRLGEITLGRIRVRVLRKVHRLHEIRNACGFPDLPPLHDGLAGYLVVSVPQPGVPGALQRRGELLGYCAKAYAHSFIDLSQDFAAYQSKFSGKTRSGLQRKVRKFTESAGGLDFREYKRPEAMAEFFRHARAVSSRSYQERLLDCGLPDHDGFLDELTAAAARDAIRAFVLFHRGEPVSYLYCPVREGVLVYSHLGYVPEVASLSAGTVLQWLALESLFGERRFSAFDFTEGESEHKRLFGTHQVTCSHHLLVKPTLRNRVLVHSHRGIDRLSTALGEVLERYHLKARVRRWVRRAA
jgi:CelD/BcsL family acetyltransferase involved in cellulose biosynthesis